MKIYSDHITYDDIRHAFEKARSRHDADIYIEDARTWQPRRHAYGVEVWAYSRNGKRPTGHRPIGTYDRALPRAASWDDWGYVIAYLYNIDPYARIGFYKSGADFMRKVTEHPRKGSDLAFLEVLNEQH